MVSIAFNFFFLKILFIDFFLREKEREGEKEEYQ